MTDQTIPSPTELAELLNASRGGFNELIGLEFTSATMDELEAKFEIGPQHLQPHGLVHGGVYAAVVETMCSVGASIQVFHSGSQVVGLDNHTSFLRATREGVITAKATPVKTGRRSQVWRTDVFDEAGKLLATGQVRLMVLENGTQVAGKGLSV